VYNFFVKTTFTDIKSFKFTLPFTDHHPIFLSVPVINEPVPKVKEFSYLKEKLLYKTAEECDWRSTYELNSVHDAIIKITEMVHLVIKKATLKTKNKKLIRRKCWVTRHIINASKKKEKLYIRTRRNPDDIVAKENYRSYMKQYEKLIKDT